MTRQQKIDDIRLKCIEANPEIVELKFGCEIERPGTGFIETLVALEAGVQLYKTACFIRNAIRINYHYEVSENEIATWKILGRPIRLADVLLAMGDTNFKEITQKRAFLVTFYPERDRNDNYVIGGFDWRLYVDDLSRQSDPTIDFIHQILS